MTLEEKGQIIISDKMYGLDHLMLFTDTVEFLSHNIDRKCANSLGILCSQNISFPFCGEYSLFGYKHKYGHGHHTWHGHWHADIVDNLKISHPKNVRDWIV